jgi:hypothetical protein
MPIIVIKETGKLMILYVVLMSLSSGYSTTTTGQQDM